VNVLKEINTFFLSSNLGNKFFFILLFFLTVYSRNQDVKTCLCKFREEV
jgi:hypothetical protein